MKPKPPAWADKFLAWYCHPDLLEEIQGDAYEIFLREVKNNPRKASLHFAWNVIRFFRWKNIRKRKKKYSYDSTAMFKNYFKIGLRNLMRHKAFSLINIMGLAIGFTCFMLIASYVYDELSYDQYAEQKNNIYRVGVQLTQNGGVDDYPHVDIAVGAGIKNEFPEVLASTRTTGKFADYVQLEDTFVKEESVVYADSNFLSIFSIPLVEGSSEKALVEPGSIVISRAFEQKYFGGKPALGEMITFRRGGLLKVTGIFDKIPDNSHFHYDAFMSMTTAPFIKARQTWSNVGFYTYVLLNEHVQPTQLEAKFPSLIEKYVVPEIQEDLGLSLADAQKSVNSWKFYLMPITDIHLRSHTKYEIEPNGDINNVYIFGVLAVFIMLLACINFMNLSTASSAKRSMEIGIRKTMGSLRDQLVLQFLIESVLVAMSALIFALVLVFIFLPFFNQLTGKHIDIQFFTSPQVIAMMTGLGLVAGIFAGTYPAFFLSSFQPLRVLKGNTGTSKRGGVRSALVIFQFAISTAIIICTLVVYQQLHFMQNIKLGYDKDQILVIENTGALQTNQMPFKQRLKDDHRVLGISNANVPMGNASSFGGSEVTAKENNTANIHAHFFSIDYDYFETLGMEVVIGRNFSKEFPSDSLGANVIINETAMHDLGWNESNVLGSTIVRSATRQHQVVGVVKDFHYTSAKDKIAPLVMFFRANTSSMLVKVKTSEIQDFVADMGKQWATMNTDLPFTYFFLDDRFEHLYEAEQTTEQIFIVFMVIAV
ncbi:MAG TPA: ABC transporter permease, partial [Cyclobacteriaceae bacterium]|nr:ABC transporter permease [Cyclobacteriaceae bacterium]